MTKESFKKLFLDLTEYTIPFGFEENLEKYLPTGFKKDSVGNYYYQIGNSKTLFTTHLDTFSEKHEKVNHLFDESDPYLIGTDETTILGGDNKLGCTILISMIEDKIPGTYYFFIGEEPILSGGLYGSKKALEGNREFFKNFERCIAFDRKEYASIVTRQMGRMCCSLEFAKSLSTYFEWDPTKSFGYYTDTAVFMDIIPECTNISAGGFNEHHVTEWVDLNYTWVVYQSARTIQWEKLPVKRELEIRFSQEKESKLKKFFGFSTDKLISMIDKLMDLIDLSKTRDLTKDGKRYLTYSRWLEDYDLDLFIKDGLIEVSGQKFNFDQFKKFLVKEFKEDIKAELEYQKEQKNKKRVKEIVKTFGITSKF